MICYIKKRANINRTIDGYNTQSSQNFFPAHMVWSILAISPVFVQFFLSYGLSFTCQHNCLCPSWPPVIWLFSHFPVCWPFLLSFDSGSDSDSVCIMSRAHCSVLLRPALFECKFRCLESAQSLRFEELNVNSFHKSATVGGHHQLGSDRQSARPAVTSHAPPPPWSGVQSP